MNRQVILSRNKMILKIKSTMANYPHQLEWKQISLACALIREEGWWTTESISHSRIIGSAHKIWTEKLKANFPLNRYWNSCPRSAADNSRASNGNSEQPGSSLGTIFGRIVIEETWLYRSDPKNKTRSKQWLLRPGPRLVKAKADGSWSKLGKANLQKFAVLFVDFLKGQEQ